MGVQCLDGLRWGGKHTGVSGKAMEVAAVDSGDGGVVEDCLGVWNPVNVRGGSVCRRLWGLSVRAKMTQLISKSA